ncbi:MAG TPA: diguanylate cyclase [Rudaea sp.]|nr:diguanylate cyclase [Rudaea sp.]
MDGKAVKFAELREASDLALINDIARIALQYMELRAMLQRIVQALKLHLGCEFVDCATLDLHTRIFTCEAVACDLPCSMHVGYTRQLGIGVVGEVAVTGRALSVPDTRKHPNYIEILPGARSELCIPVRHGGEVVAILNVESRTVDAFRERRLLLETVAEQVAGAIAAARLNQELRRRVDVLGMMSGLLRVAVDAGDLGQALESIARFVHARFHLEFCGILLFDAARAMLVLKAEAGRATLDGKSFPEWPVDLGVNGRAVRTRASQFVPDVRADPDYVMCNGATRTEYVVPILFRGELIGVIDMESASYESFTDENRAMLDALAAQVAGAIHLASTNQRLTDMVREVADKSAALEDANAKLRAANRELHRLSHSDGLTGIGNRRRFDEGLRSEWRRARRQGRPLSLLLLDIDDFKAYNDGYGHLAGDDCLKRIAAALRTAAERHNGLLARYGGEEFAVLLPDTEAGRALRCGEEMQQALATLALPHRFSRASAHVTASFGVMTLRPRVVMKPSEFIRCADHALYTAKAEGRNQIVLAPESH